MWFTSKKHPNTIDEGCVGCSILAGDPYRRLHEYHGSLMTRNRVLDALEEFCIKNDAELMRRYGSIHPTDPHTILRCIACEIKDKIEKIDIEACNDPACLCKRGVKLAFMGAELLCKLPSD
jgi:hypothetical protein